jgi:hypothetical protein
MSTGITASESDAQQAYLEMVDDCRLYVERQIDGDAEKSNPAELQPHVDEWLATVYEDNQSTFLPTGIINYSFGGPHETWPKSSLHTLDAEERADPEDALLALAASALISDLLHPP